MIVSLDGPCTLIVCNGTQISLDVSLHHHVTFATCSLSVMHASQPLQSNGRFGTFCWPAESWSLHGVTSPQWRASWKLLLDQNILRAFCWTS